MPGAADTALLALVEGADEATLARVAARLRPWLSPAEHAPEPDRWVETREAARIVGLSTNALHKLTARRARGGIPFSQDAPGGKCYFRVSDLHRWREQKRGVEAA